MENIYNSNQQLQPPLLNSDANNLHQNTGTSNPKRTRITRACK